MKRNGAKCFALLHAYHELLSKKEIELDHLIEKYNISRRTAYRYISLINVFFADEFLPYEVKFKRSLNKYVLINSSEVNK